MKNTIFLCVSCNRKLQEGIFTDDFAVTLIKVMLPLAILLPLLYYYAKSLKSTATEAKRTPVMIFSLLIGIGMGGFVRRHCAAPAFAVPPDAVQQNRPDQF